MLATWFVLGLLFRQGCSSRLLVDVSPTSAVVLPNQNVTYRCRMASPLQYCRVEIPGIGRLNLNSNLEPGKAVSYYGAGLNAGECGFVINRVSEENNGKITCFVGVETSYEEPTGIMELTVAKAPKSPELDLSKGADSVGVYRINEVLQASCIVREGRPVANISWYLDDEPIYDGLSIPTDFNVATSDDLHTKFQNLTRTLHASDNGRHLKCVASHPALIDRTAIAMRLLDVKYPPLPLGNPIDKFGYEIGKPGIISVEIEANPKPHLEWTVREQRIREGSVDSTGRIDAEMAIERGRGTYIANLRIAAINKQDTETQFILSAYNDMGRQDYTVLISTSPEPEGLDLSVGSIIGIVASLLIVFVIIFVVIMARVKGKWCFSGGARVIDYTGGESCDQHSSPGDGVDNPHHQNSQEYINVSDVHERRAATENSDTESADLRPKETKRTLPSLNLAAMFKKKSDKVSHEEEDVRQMETAEAKAPTEDAEPKRETSPPQGKENKEGLVYAELDLVSHNLKPVLKNDDDKTEYAEIVYTNEGASQQKETAAKGES